MKKKGVIENYRWRICALLFVATTVNYMDRQVLSLLKPLLSQEYHWTESDYGTIAAIFSGVYAIAMLFAGRIVDNLGTKRAYLLAIFIWSVGAILHAAAIPMGEGVNVVFAWLGIPAVSVSIAGFVIAVSVLAIGEAGNFPGAIKTTAEYFPKKERSLATGIFNSGANIGAILAPLTVPWIAEHWGWQYAFVMIGALGFFWMVSWEWFYDKPEKQRRLSANELKYIQADDIVLEANAPQVKALGWLQLLKYRQAWAFIIGKFLTDCVWFFYFFWLPSYIHEQYHLEKTEIAFPLAILYSMTMIGSITGGYFPMYFIKKGYISFDARMRAMLLIALMPLLVLFAQPYASLSLWVPILLIGVAGAAHQAFSANLFTIPSDLFPKRSVGSLVGIGGMAGGIGSVLMQKSAGWIKDYYAPHVDKGYSILFGYCAVAYVIAWFIMKALVPKFKQVTEAGEHI